MASRKKTVIFRATKQEVFDLLEAAAPAGFFGSKAGSSYPTQFDIREDPNDPTKLEIMFTEENEPNP